MIVYTWTYSSPIGPVHLAATEAGVCRITFGAEHEDRFRHWIDRRLRPDRLVTAQAPFRWLGDQFLAYFAGRAIDFAGPLDLRGSDFQQQVWQAVRRVPFGETRTYADIAGMIGRASAVRAVGAANAANPLPLVIPCHRLIGRDSSLRGYGGGIALKVWLLRHEGIAVNLPEGGEASARSWRPPER